MADVLRLQFPGIWMSGRATDQPSEYPAVTLVERDNAVLREMSSVQSPEMAATVMYQADVYSNLVGGAKLEARKILQVLDEVMTGMGFARISLSPVDNLQDSTIYRLVARYEATVDRDLWIYRR